MSETVVFPIIELTDWVFEDERVFFADMSWDPVHFVKEKDFEKHKTRVIVDSAGNVYNVSAPRIKEKPRAWLSFIIQPTLLVEFDLKKTGQVISLDELKNLILSRKEEIFHITYNKLMTLEEFEDKINKSKTYEELIMAASFGDVDPQNDSPAN